MRIGMICCMAGAIAWGITSRSQGAILTFGFEGDVTSVHDPVGVLDFVKPGQRFIYTFSFDTETPNVRPDQHPTSAWYDGIASSLTVGGFPFTSGVPFIEISTPGFFNVNSGIDWDHPDLLPVIHSVYVRLSGGDAVQTINLPTTPYNLDLFGSKGFSVSFAAPGGSTDQRLSIIGDLDSMHFVPEPIAALMLALASLVVSGKRRLC